VVTTTDEYSLSRYPPRVCGTCPSPWKVCEKGCWRGHQLIFKGLHDLWASPVRNMVLDPARDPRLLCAVSFSTRKSARISTRFGRGPPGGVTQYTAPDGIDQSGSNLSSRPAASASRKMNSGRIPTPVPAISAGIMASPLFTRSGPDGRTLVDLPPLVKRQISVVIA
jgi:hypothetical protein